jgi:hypothetical protein
VVYIPGFEADGLDFFAMAGMTLFNGRDDITIGPFFSSPGEVGVFLSNIPGIGACFPAGRCFKLYPCFYFDPLLGEGFEEDSTFRELR